MSIEYKTEKIIGLIVGGISNEFSKDIIKGVINSIPRGSNIRLAILPGKHIIQDFSESGFEEHNSMFNSIYNLGRICKMDGLIIATGSIEWKMSPMDIQAFLKRFDGIETVLIASDEEGYTTVNYDNEMGIKEAIDCLVSIHNFHNICMLGGYEESADSVRRKNIYLKCLKDNEINFEERFYVASDMSENTEEAAEKLLDSNPDVEAIFCVNDASAVGLYEVMKNRGLVPGRDIFVFGFDNTKKSAHMSPTLASIGSESVMLGQKALELLLAKIDGEQVESVEIPTKLYGRQSFEYYKYEFTFEGILKSDEATINRMFDICFYRYANENIKRENVNIKRLFYEIISRMYKGLKKRYIGMDEFNEICHLIDVFFENGAMEYTDVWKFLQSIYRLQTGTNRKLRARENPYFNRLFLRMKDDALISLSEMKNREYNELQNSRMMMSRYIIKGMNYSGDKKLIQQELMKSLGLLGIQNAAFYLFEQPLLKENIEAQNYPDSILLKSVIKSGKVFLIPESKQKRALSEIYVQRELREYNYRFVSFPIFYEKYFYGLLLSELTNDIYDKGELISNITGMMLHVNNIS